MDPQGQASFIPKKSFDTVAPRGGAFGGLLLLIATFLFLASAVAAGGVFAYQRYLTDLIAKQSDSLQKAEAAFDPAAIQELSRMDSRINNASALLQHHVASSAIFSFLAGQTLPGVQFTSFEYVLQPDGSAKVSLNGAADSFASIALQSDQLNANKLLKNVVFSNIQVGQKGGVTFTTSMLLGAATINYGNNLTSATTATTASTTPVATPTTPAPAQPTQ